MVATADYTPTPPPAVYWHVWIAREVGVWRITLHTPGWWCNPWFTYDRMPYVLGHVVDHDIPYTVEIDRTVSGAVAEMLSAQLLAAGVSSWSYVDLQNRALPASLPAW